MRKYRLSAGVLEYDGEMTTGEILLWAAEGKRASEIARMAQLPITAVHRVLYGYGRNAGRVNPPQSLDSQGNGIYKAIAAGSG